MCYTFCYAEKDISTQKIEKSQKTRFQSQKSHIRRQKSFKKKKSPRSSEARNLMLPKSQRLNLKTDFKWVVSGQKLETKYLKLFIKQGENKITRVGIATSSKSFKKATERNRARRLASSAIESVYDRLPKDVNIVALPKASVTGVKSSDVLLDLETVLKNEKIIN